MEALVAGLKEVPAHWEVTKLKRLVDPERPITYGIVQAGEHVPDGVPYIRPADMQDEQGVMSPESLLRTAADVAASYGRSTIRAGDLVCSIGPSFGKVMVVPAELAGANLTQGTARVAVQAPNESRFVFWTLRSQLSAAQWEAAVGGATFRALNLTPLSNTVLLAPPWQDQTAIAAFLDRETAKIDALIAEQRRLIDLLREKRQVVISHAVTKGLNPDAPMKPSGVEWLGNVPAHWKVSRLGRLLRGALRNGISPELSDEDGVPTFSTAAVREGAVDIHGHVKMARLSALAAEPYRVERGDIFALRGSGSKDFVGTAGIVEEEPPAGCIYPDILIRVRPAAQVRPRYLVACMNCLAVRPQIETAAQTAAGIWKVSASSLSAIRLPLPPPDEQDQILRFVEGAVNSVGNLARSAEHAISLLRERRAALISAAVTGQIDVRPLAEVQTE